MTTRILTKLSVWGLIHTQVMLRNTLTRHVGMMLIVTTKLINNMMMMMMTMMTSRQHEMTR